MQGHGHPDDALENTERAPGSAGPYGTAREQTVNGATFAEGSGEGPVDATFASEAGQTVPPLFSRTNAEAGTVREGGFDDSIGIQGRPLPGQVLFGRYKTEKLLGEGGMGTVWLVRHLALDTQRALKLIVSGIAFDGEAQARFQREARVMARLSHPHAVVVHDAHMARDAAFIEMEYIRGRSLNQLLTQGAPMPLDWIARILEQLCDVLQEAHAQNIVHRDLKPANLMLVDGRPVGREQLKVLDFGIAKILGTDAEDAEVHTRTGCFMGSAPYSSPEQAHGAAVDGRSDLYSVGIILYELLTGHRPFGGILTRVIHDHLYTPPPPFRSKNPTAHLPAAIERVVFDCLAKDPADRPQSALELIERFRRALPSGGSVASSHSGLPLTEIAPLVEPSQPKTVRDHVLDPTPDGLAAPGYEKTVDGLKVPYQGISQPPTPRPLPWAAARSSGAVEADVAPGVSSGTILPEKESPVVLKRRKIRRRLIAGVLLVGVAVLGAVAFFVRRPATPTLKLPDGYKAENPQELVGGYPKVLVRISDGTRFSRIEGGTFAMGDVETGTAPQGQEDRPVHPVTLTGYYLQQTEVTNGEMDAYFRAKQMNMTSRPKRWSDAWNTIDKAGDNPKQHPAVGITHEMAEDYAHWVAGQLPTEAQWEYAARSRGKNHRYVWAEDQEPNPSWANINTLSLIGAVPTVEVGKKTRDRTLQDIADLTGNVREWCRDVWEPYVLSKEPIQDPVGAARSSSEKEPFVVRGGSFDTFADRFRTTRPRHPERDEDTSKQLAEDQTAFDLGFRVVIEGPPHP